MKNLHSTLVPELLQLYDLDAEQMLNKSDDVVVTEFTFIHPRDVVKLVKLLRDQLVFNNLFESLCRIEPNGSTGNLAEKKVLQVRVDSKKALEFNFFFEYGSLIVSSRDWIFL